MEDGDLTNQLLSHGSHVTTTGTSDLTSVVEALNVGLTKDAQDVLPEVGVEDGSLCQTFSVGLMT